MAVTMATSMATILNTRCFCTRNIDYLMKPTKPILSFLPTAAQPQGLAAGLIFSSLSAKDPAFAAHQLAELAEGDNHGLALLIPLFPAVGAVQHIAAYTQSKMRNSEGVIIGLGLGGLAASGFFDPMQASAGEIAAVAEAAASDSRGQLLLLVLTPAILWVLYNILQPALNQINKMRK